MSLIDSDSMGDVEDIAAGKDIGEEGKENVADVVDSNARATAESILQGSSIDVKKELLRLLMDGEACEEGKSDDGMFESLRDVSTYKLVEVVIKRRADSGEDSLATQVWNGYRGTSLSESSLLKPLVRRLNRIQTRAKQTSEHVKIMPLFLPTLLLTKS